LTQQIDAFFDCSADPETRGGGEVRWGRILALIAPHAGFVYSGAVAACGFRGLRDTRVDRVILAGPSHYAAFRGAVVPSAGAYRTPLGEVPIDTEAIAQLESAWVKLDDEPFRPEHSLEAEIPFLQRVLRPGWRLLPVLLGAGTSGPGAESVAQALRPLVGSETLLVVSSDFTHFGPRFGYVPFDTDVPTRIEKLDMGAIDRILAHDPQGFEDYVQRTGATICGRDAIGVLLRLLPRGLSGDLAGYDTSGRMTGDWDHSVSYASLVFRQRPGATTTGHA
jgi:AmmeMemoRadiSam system protein B